MPLLDVLEDIKVWIAAAIVLALVIGFDSPDASTIMMVALIAQMAVALDGIQFGRDDFSKYKEPILVNIVCCFGLCTGITLLTGLFFMDDQALWTGWVMLSSVPCAISVVPSALFLKADPKLAVLSLTVIYVVAIAVTPLITHVLIGDSVNPLEVLRYILMFILIPFVLTVPLKRLHLKRAPKTVFINIMMFVLVFAGLGSRQEFVFGEPTVVLALVVACILRIFVVSTVMIGIITYVSVVERIKEIGVIRAMGGRKRDVKNLFTAETFIIGLLAGLIGIIVTYLLSIVANIIIGTITGVYTIAALPPWQALIMVALSVVLTLISGLLPASKAAKQDPVVALRTE